jgi:glycosyltransferase involved in cell wall biosynthesis
LSQTRVKNILYFFPHWSTFIDRDIVALRQDYHVDVFEFKSKHKWRYPIEFIRQFFFIFFRLKRDQVWICHFAGHASLMPAYLAKIFKKRFLIIVAGTDASKFPSINYGNFNRRLLGWSTSKSLENASMILPVHESLVYQKYEYDPSGAPAQGYTVFAPKTKFVPFTAIPYGYDLDFYKPDNTLVRVPNSFVTIGILNESNVFYRKGMDMLIELAKLRPEASFTIVGGDDNNLSLPDNVKLLPKSSPEQIVRILSISTFYLQLSLMEGFPNALAEAMLCGCIPIGSNVSGIPDIIGDCGIVLEKKDLSRLNLLINELIEASDLNTLSVKSRERIICYYSANQRFQKMKIAID